MKQLIFFLLLFVGLQGAAQKFAYIDSRVILEQVPAYKEAQKELDDLSQKWQQEIEQKHTEINEMRNVYQEEKILLPADIQKKREDEIANLEREARELQRARFGVNGELFQKRQELIKPIQDKMYKAMKSVAQDKYTFVFDIAGQTNILYADPKVDLSDKVLREMGY